MSVYWNSHYRCWFSDVPAEQQVLERELGGSLTNSDYDRDMLQAIVDRALETAALALSSVVVGRSDLRPGDAIYIGGDRARVVSIEGTTLTVERDSQLRGRHYETVAVDDYQTLSERARREDLEQLAIGQEIDGAVSNFQNLSREAAPPPAERIEDRHISELNKLRQKLNSLPKGKTYQRKEIEKQIRRYETKSDREKLRIAEAQISKLEKHIKDLEVVNQERLIRYNTRMNKDRGERTQLLHWIWRLHDEIIDQPRCPTDKIEAVVETVLRNIRQLKNPPQRVSDKPRRIKLD